MIDFKTSSTTPPVIVCGNPRSGTRMHAAVLNAHPNILITDEYHDLKGLQEHVSKFRRSNLLGKFSREMALARQMFLAKMLWVSYSIDRIVDRDDEIRLIGNKTPQIELKYQILENIFRSCPPYYVYCLRSAPKVLRSVKNLTNLRWNKDTVEVNLNRYIRSVRVMEEMKASFPDRVVVSVIDNSDHFESRSKFFEPVFAFLGVDFPDSTRLTVDKMELRIRWPS